MAYEIIWSAEADNDLKLIANYINEKWSFETAKKFLIRTSVKLEKLAKTPSIARSTSKNSIYIFKPDSKNVVFFTLENNYLVLLSIYPYRKDITKSRYY